MPSQRTARVVVVDNVVYQNGEDKAITVPVRFAYPLKTEEQPYSRKMKIGKEWKPMEKGWIEKCSMMVLENREKQAGIGEDAKVIEMSFHHSLSVDFTIPPGQSMRGCPANLKATYVRCLGGEASLFISLFPE